MLAAYEVWGAAAVEHLVGTFALALWDADRQGLLLARDRLGVAPLYYLAYDGGVLFGSEPKALLANPLFEPEVDAEGLADIFVVAAKRPGDAVYRGLREVRPGHTVWFDRTGVRHSRYWSLPVEPHRDDLAVTTDRARQLLARAVSGQSEAEIPVGSLLSGGIDSSVITAFAAQARARRGQGKLATYSVDFVDSEQDFAADALHGSRDAPYVQAVVDHVGTNHSEVLLAAPSLLDHLGTSLRARDIPGVGDLDVSLYLLFREVRRHLGVALSGEGADDIFGGYPWFAAEATQATGSFPWSAGVLDRNAVLSADLRRQLDLHAYVDARYREALAEVPVLDGEQRVDRRLREVTYLQLTRFLPFLLDRKDRMSMAVGLNVRLPFTDHRLVEYIWNVPWSLRGRGEREKSLLRAAGQSLLPAAVVQRPKSGFPFGQSPHYLSAVRSAVLDLLSDQDAPVLQLLDADVLRQMAQGGAWTNGSFTPPPWLPRALALNAWLKDYGVRVRI